jgi:hypothetical protein
MIYERLLERLEEPTNDRMDAYPDAKDWHLRGDCVLVRYVTLDDAVSAIKKLEDENELLLTDLIAERKTNLKLEAEKDVTKDELEVELDKFTGGGNLIEINGPNMQKMAAFLEKLKAERKVNHDSNKFVMGALEDSEVESERLREELTKIADQGPFAGGMACADIASKALKGENRDERPDCSVCNGTGKTSPDGIEDKNHQLRKEIESLKSRIYHLEYFSDR